MNIVRINVSTTALKTLSDIDELSLTRASLIPLGNDRWRISGYATDAAIEAVRGLGAEVEVLFTADQRLAHLDRVAEQARATDAEEA